MCVTRVVTIFLESWSRNESDNNYLLDTLLPWLSRINMHCMPGLLKKYIDQNQIGCPPLAADDPLLLHMIRRMALSAKNFEFTIMLLEFLI